MIINVRVIPNAKTDRVIADDQDKLKVYLNAKPHKGKANKALAKVLADYYNVRKSSIRIIKGKKTRDKVVEIETKG